MQALKLKSGEEVCPLRSLVVLRPAEVDEGVYKLKEGLVMPGTITGVIPPQQGEVLAFGPGAKKVSLGDVVVYGLGTGRSVYLDGSLVLVLAEDEIIGKVEVN